ncbi:MAG: tetratricopeptide repeat protein [Myxococcota bacterium]
MQDAAHAIPDRRRIGLFALALCALTLFVYHDVGAHQFVDFDDYEYIVDNPYLDGHLSLEDIRRAFSEPYKSNWAPLMSISLAVSDALYGPVPGAYAWENVLLHLLASVLLFLAFVRMTGRVEISAFVAAVFAVHPLHVESVAWISERKEVLAGVFWMATLFVYPSWVRTRKASAAALILLWSTLALFAKATAVAIPVTLLLLDLWPLHRIKTPRDFFRCALEKAPIAAAAAAVSAVTLLSQTESGANTSAYTPLLLRGLNAARAYRVYLVDTFWPSGLAYYYPYPSDALLTSPATWITLALLVAMTLMALVLIRRAPLVTMGWLWFIVTLIPMIGLVRVGGQAHADRYTYIAQTGLVCILAFGVSDLIKRRSAAEPLPSAPPKPLLFAGRAIAAIAILALAFLAQRQVGTWRDSETLFSHAVAVTERNAHAHRFLGVAQWTRGDQKSGEAHLREALSIRPQWGDARLVLATALLQTGRLQEAAVELDLATQQGAPPELAWAARGILAEQSGREREAAQAFSRALELGSEDWQVLNNLAWIRAASENVDLRDPAAAVVLAERAIVAQPENPFVLGTLAAAYAGAGQPKAAIQAQRRALERLEQEEAPNVRALLPSFRARLNRYLRGLPAWSTTPGPTPSATSGPTPAPEPGGTS